MFRYNFSSYCLGALFTNRIFDDLVLGLSWRGNPIPGGVGGICQSLARYKADGKERKQGNKQGDIGLIEGLVTKQLGFQSNGGYYRSLH